MGASQSLPERSNTPEGHRCETTSDITNSGHGNMYELTKVIMQRMVDKSDNEGYGGGIIYNEICCIGGVHLVPPPKDIIGIA